MAKETEKHGFLARLKSIAPKRDNRRNEWSPLPTGIIIGAFTAPVSAIFLVGTALDTDTGLSPLYGLLCLLTGLIVVWSVSDGSYIAGMRRIANQDLREDFVSDAPSTSLYHEFPTMQELKDDAQYEEDKKQDTEDKDE